MTSRIHVHRRTIRRATPEDAATVHALVLEIAAHEGNVEDVQATPQRWEAILERDDVVVLLAERDRLVLGYTSAGAGTSIAEVRLNCPAEITVHTLLAG